MSWTMEQKVFCVKSNYKTKSFKIVQARYRRKFNLNTFPNRHQIFKLVKNIEGHRVMGSSPPEPPITIQIPMRNAYALSTT